MPEAGRVGDIAWVPVDSHGHDCCLHSALGPAVMGSPDCYINGVAALRVGDPGTHSACCGENTWKAATGAPGVFINDLPAHRVRDTTNHCGGVGVLITGSPNVVIGDYGGHAEASALQATLTRTSPFDGGFIVIDEESGEPVVGRRYRITFADGSVIEGRTNERGRTIVVDTESPEEIHIDIFEDDEFVSEGDAP